MDPEETDDMLAELTGGNERERVVGARTRDVVAKLGAAAAARAGSNRSPEISSSTSVVNFWTYRPNCAIRTVAKPLHPG